MAAVEVQSAQAGAGGTVELSGTIELERHALTLAPAPRRRIATGPIPAPLPTPALELGGLYVFPGATQRIADPWEQLAAPAVDRLAITHPAIQITRPAMLVKRGLDLLVAALGLLALAPLLALIAVAIKLDGSGTVLYRQRRVGRHGRHFAMLKFRTMVPGADAMKDALRARNEARDGLFKIAEDPRVTRIGGLLRRSALDELPQLFNVLKGEMSLVGPRPLVVDEDARIAGRHRRRLELLPGMTGPWQILGPARASLAEMAAIDGRYVEQWSLWADLKILLRTVPHVVRRRGL